MVPLTMGKCKTKAIQTDLGTFRHNQTYPEINQHIQAYLEPYVALTFLKLWYIQNPDKLFGKIVNGYNYFHK